MKGEIPVFRRCCFCLPLRYGLLGWGYFKIIADVFLVFFTSFIFIQTLFWMRFANGDYMSRIYTELIISMIAVALFFTDFIVTIVFIIGGHTKNVKLIRVFYFVSMGMWVATVLLASITTISLLHDMFKYGHPYFHIGQVLVAISFYFVVIVVQTYILLLLRSEIIKLRNIGEFRFVNNAAEAECTMRCEEVIIASETVTPNKEKENNTEN